MYHLPNALIIVLLFSLFLHFQHFGHCGYECPYSVTPLFVQWMLLMIIALQIVGLLNEKNTLFKRLCYCLNLPVK